jgi:hypothetical protein
MNKLIGLQDLIGKEILLAERVRYERIGNGYAETVDEGIFLTIKDDGTVRFIHLQPEGDCCANCYIENLDGADVLVGIVREVQDLQLPPVSGENVIIDEVSDVWGHRIITDKGICTIEMRVDHNGYYGGSLSCDMLDEKPTELYRHPNGSYTVVHYDELTDR